MSFIFIMFAACFYEKSHLLRKEMEKEFIDIKLDKSSFSVISLSEQHSEANYWLTASPVQRLQHMEVLRRINYGNSAASRLQRILENSEP